MAKREPAPKVCSKKDCAKAGIVQPVEAFYKHKNATDGLQWWCRKCKTTSKRTADYKAYSKEYNSREQTKALKRRRNRTPEGRKKNNEGTRRWLLKNPQRADEYRRARVSRINSAPGGRFDAAKRQAVFERFGRLCFYSGYLGDIATTIDHTLAVSRGGSNRLENLRPACFECQNSKGSKLPREWEDRMYRLRDPNNSEGK